MSGSDLPVIRFTERRLANGLRVIVAPDHLAPVVAVNLWYDVGSKHEQLGKTGFAHLFEHFMFQGSRNVAKSEHMAIIQGAGGVNNATTYFDRTNYFETLPSHQLELALWLEADRMGTLLDALSQENLDNQRDVVKNEKRQSYDNRPYGSFYEKIMAALFPLGHPYHHTPIGSMADLDAASLDDVTSFFRAWYGPDNAVLTIAGDVDEEPAFAAAERYFGPIPARVTRPPDFVVPRRPPRSRCRDARGRARRRAARARARRLPHPALRQRRLRRAGGGHPHPGRRARQPHVPAPRARGARGPGRGRVHPAAHRRRLRLRGLGDGAARVGRGHRRADVPRGGGTPGLGAGHRLTSWRGRARSSSRPS